MRGFAFALLGSFLLSIGPGEASKPAVVPEECRGLAPTESQICVDRHRTELEKKQAAEAVERERQERAMREALDNLGCKTDDDCVAIKNGCGVKSVVGSSPNIHTRFQCRCERDEHSSACVRVGK